MSGIKKKSKSYMYIVEDTSNREKTFEKKKLTIVKVGGNFMSHYVIITEYMKRHTHLSEIDLHLLCHLACFNSTVHWEMIYNYPLALGIRKSKKKIDEFIDKGLLELFQEYSKRDGLKKKYHLTIKARNIVRLYNDLMLKIKTISLISSNSDNEFVTRRSNLERGKCKINYYGNIVKFNKLVK